MAGALLGRGDRRGETPRAETPDVRLPAPGELAWMVAVPCALVTLAAIVALAPTLAELLLERGREPLWPRTASFVAGHSEPVKYARYLLALLGPALFVAAIVVGRRRAPALRSSAISAWVLASQVLVAAFVGVAMWRQHMLAADREASGWVVFGVPTLAAGAVLAALGLALGRAVRSSRPIEAWTRDTRPRRAAVMLVATIFTAMWVFVAVDTDGTIAFSPLSGLMAWTLDDAFAVLNGLTSLGDYHPVYAQLWPYPAAAAIAVFGDSVAVYTTVMATASAAALLLVLGILRRVTRSPLLALGLYLPFLATSLLFVRLPGASLRFTNAQTFSVLPMRYGGAFLVAWLTARHLGQVVAGRLVMLFFVVGLVVIDNVQFGIAAGAAAVAALIPVRAGSRQLLLRAAAEAAVGLLGAAAAVTTLVLLRTGSPPDWSLVLEFPRLFGAAGLLSFPMPAVGFHLIVYVTFAAAIALAAVRGIARQPNATLTGMLLWSGIFGLLAASYYVGNPDIFKLGALLPAWSLALVLLTAAAIEGLAARGWRRPSLAEVLVLAGFGAAVCSLAETPAPWSQVERLRQATAQLVVPEPGQTAFVDAVTERGEAVVILLPLGHRIAFEAGVRNVSPYALLEAVVTRRQLGTVLAAAQRAGADKLFLPPGLIVPAHVRALQAAGYTVSASTAAVSEWSNARQAPAGR